MNQPTAMNSIPKLQKHRLIQGQLLIIAVIILGVMLVLGLVFAGIVGRNITESTRGRQRSVAGDLADAGIRFSHYQLQSSELGADWRPAATPLGGGNFSKDPDALYLRRGSGFNIPRANPTNPDRLDLGGPDGLGPFARMEFENGRALIRVRYAPTDVDAFGTPGGVFRQKGRARSYLILESVGRPGKINANDPSTLLGKAVQIAGYGSQANFTQQYGFLRQQDHQVTNSRKLMAFASVGIIEQARFVTDFFNLSRPAELGNVTAPTLPGDPGPDNSNLGIRYEGQDVRVATRLGGDLDTAAFNVLASGTGSFRSNTSVVMHGRWDVALNPEIGDKVLVAGSLTGANNEAVLNITRYSTSGTNFFNLGNVVPGPSFNSNQQSFTTVTGLVRDGSRTTDAQGFTRAVGRLEPPSILAKDPATNLTRYFQMTRNSGQVVNGINIGRFGYGQGVYVDVRARANADTEEDRENLDVFSSLPNDWLNPNNAGKNSGWQGPYYRPLAAYLELLPDGFRIIRDSRLGDPNQRYWRNVNGTSTGTSVCRFRLRQVGLQVYAINSIINAGIINQAIIPDQTYVQQGVPFNGVIYFEGDVRTRGVIPSFMQLSVVSMGSIYIEGSITKGQVTESGQLVNAMSSSALALMARDYVTLNTTQFFAPSPGQTLNAKSEMALPDTPNPLELDQTEQPEVELQAQFLLDRFTQGGNRWDASTWLPYALTYRSAVANTPIDPVLLFNHSADDNGPAMVSMGITPYTVPSAGPFPTANYLFLRNYNFNSAGVVQVNPASNYFPPGPPAVPVYALGNPAINAFPRFETMAFPLQTSAISTLQYSTATHRMTAPGGHPQGQFALAVQDETGFRIRLDQAGPQASKNYLLARSAVTPHDIRIEAALYAQEGSFFVIPGQSFNYNPDDTRELFNQNVGIAGLDLAQRERYEKFGMSPEAPFYNEPLAVRVVIHGAISENMPAPISQQAAWQRKWGWIPRFLGATTTPIPASWVPSGVVLNTNPNSNAGTIYVPNLILEYDPALAMGSADGISPTRNSPDGLWVLPPMPRLPVSQTLSYFGEVNP